MNKQPVCLPTSFREALDIKRLEDTRRALIARRMNKYADRKIFSRQRTLSQLSSAESSSGSATETSVTNVVKNKPCGYLTLLDVSTLVGFPTPASNVLPDTEFAPNSFHQEFHVSRWKAFMKTCPKWILEMGMEDLERRQSQNRKTPKERDKENFELRENSDSQFLQEKHDKENNVCNNNVQECTIENPEMEKELGNEKHGIAEEENGTSVCTEEWRDWSLQLTENGSLIITRKADKNVINRSRDVSSCQRVDARTLRLSDGTVYKLVGMPDHFTSLPYYVRNKFQCGFPDDWKEVKLAWEKYVEQGSLCSFSWPRSHLSECRNISTTQKDKTVTETSSSVEEIECVEAASRPLNSVVQSLCSDTSQVATVDRVGEALSRLTVEQERGKQLDVEETESCNQELNSAVAQECGKEMVVEGRKAACGVQPSSVTVQEGAKKSDLKELEVRLYRLSSCMIKNYNQQSDFTEAEVSCKQSSDTAVSLLEQLGTVPAITMSSVVLPVNTDRPSPCDTSNITGAPVNTGLDGGEGNTLLNPYILHRWAPVLVAEDKLKLVGYLKSTCSADVFHTTDVIACRKNFDSLKCHDGTFYRLQGPVADPQKTAVKNLTHGRGSVIPLKELEGEGIIKKSSRGRIVVPPVRYWLGERLVQQYNQPAFFSPRTGVQKVIVNQSVDSVRFQKKRKCSESESERVSSKRRGCEGKTEFTIPKEKGRVVSNRTWSGRDRKVNTQPRKGRRVLEVDTNTTSHSRFMPKQRESSMRFCESHDPVSDAISVEAREGSRILSGRAQNFKRLVASKSVSSSQSLNNTVNRSDKCSLGTRKHRELEDFKGETSKQRGYVGVPFDICDSEDELLTGMERKCSESESERVSSKRRGCEGKTEFTIPKEKGRVVSNRTWSGRDRKVNTQPRKGRRVLEVDTNTTSHSRFMPKQRESSMRFCESHDPVSDAISVEAREGSRILSGRAQNFKRLVASKSVSSSQSLNNTVNRSDKCSLGTRKHRELEDFKGETSKQRGYVGVPFDICDSEDELLTGMPTDISVRNPGTYSPLSVRRAASPVQYFKSVLGVEDKADSPRPVLSPWQQHRWKDIDRFVKGQQTMEGNMENSVLEPTTGTEADKFGTANDRISPVFTVRFDVVEDKASSFDEEDLSSSYFSTADSRK